MIYMYLQKLLILFSIILLFCFNTITPDLYPSFKTRKRNSSDSLQKQIPPQGSINLYGSERFIERWDLDHFAPKPGKILGIWTVLEYTAANLSYLRNHWGYNYIFIKNGNDYEKAIEAGFGPSNLMMDVRFPYGTNNYRTLISTYNAQYYYLGEAVNHDCGGNAGKRLYSPAELKKVLTYIHIHRPESFLVSDGYKRCSHFDSLASNVDIIMYSSYKNWYQSIFPCIADMDWGPGIEFAWLPGAEDQRDSWTSMKLHYPDFTMTWINTKEGDEFNDLFQKANELQINAVWVYGFTENNGIPVPHFNDHFPEISSAAYQHGFLKKYIRKVYDVYRCDCSGGCNSLPPDSCWKYVRTEMTDIVVEGN